MLTLVGGPVDGLECDDIPFDGKWVIVPLDRVDFAPDTVRIRRYTAVYRRATIDEAVFEGMRS